MNTPRYLLDTNACIKLLNGTSQAVADRLRDTPPSRVHLCSVVKAELLFGARKSTRPADNLRLLARFFGPFPSVPFDDDCADRYGTIRHELQRQGRPIGPNDLMIAAIAVTRNLTLVTHNVDEFSRIPDLSWEDWE